MFYNAEHVDHDQVSSGQLPPLPYDCSCLICYLPDSETNQLSKSIDDIATPALYALNLKYVPPDVWAEISSSLDLEKLPCYFFVDKEGEIGQQIEIDDLLTWLEAAAETE